MADVIKTVAFVVQIVVQPVGVRFPQWQQQKWTLGRPPAQKVPQ